MTRDDESFTQLNASIEAFERAGLARRQRMEREPGTLPTRPSWRRRWRMLMGPAVIAGLALLASLLYPGLRDQVEPLPPDAVDRADPAAVIDGTGAELVQKAGGRENVALDATQQLTDVDDSTRSVNGVVLNGSEQGDRDLVVATDAEAAVDTVETVETEGDENGNNRRTVADRLQVETGAVADAPQQDRYAIQVASFNTTDRATGLAERLADAGYPSSVVESRQGADPTRFRVRIGPYTDRQAAEAVGRRVELEQALAWYVVTLR